MRKEGSKKGCCLGEFVKGGMSFEVVDRSSTLVTRRRGSDTFVLGVDWYCWKV